ncbi:Glycosyltransferase family 20 [Paracidovorax cattleyae]|uniref:Glycosyltransferase family 20 n=1 Tax=Paracidovorax cattleyae TaxID=80868 RepID=A0A1H0WQR9_9BURK|nr:Glycosyltransferase family 20 [Paracidovorax cattleyae]
MPPAYRPAIAQPYEAALSMPLDERRERHARLQDNVKTQDLAKWREDYLAALRFAPRGPYWRHGRSGGAGRERRSGDNRVLFPLRRIP